MKTTTQKFKHLIAAAAAVAFSFLSLTSWAVKFTWTGGGTPNADGSYNWNEVANWSCDNSDRTKYPYPKNTQNDDVNFPAQDQKLVLVMPPITEAVTPNKSGIIGIQLTYSTTFNGGDFEFRANPASTVEGYYLFQAGGTALDLSNVNSLTLDGVWMWIGHYGNATRKDATMGSGHLILKNGAVFSCNVFTHKSGGVVQLFNRSYWHSSFFHIGTGSTSGDPSILEIDDSDVDVGVGSGNTSNYFKGNRIVLKGRRPRFFFHSSNRFQASNSAQLDVRFVIPAGGYAADDGSPWVPITTTTAKTFPDSGSAVLAIDPDSGVFSSSFDKIIPLLGWYSIDVPNNFKNRLTFSDIIPAQSGASGAWQLSSKVGTCAKIADSAALTADDYGWQELAGMNMGDKSTTYKSIGAHIVGVSPDPVPPAMGDAITAVAGLDGKSFSAAVTVTDLGRNFDSASVTPQLLLQYRESGATDWIDADAKNVTAAGEIVFDVTLPAAVGAETEFELQVISRVTVDGEDFDSAPLAGSVTLEPAALDVPVFPDEGALVAKSVGGDALTMTATLAGLGDGAASCTLKLMIREAGASGDGTEAASADLTAAGSVDLAAANLAPGTPYEVCVIAANDRGKAVATAWTGVTTLAVAPTLGELALDVGCCTAKVSTVLSALGAKGVTVTLDLYLREGASGDGAVVATSNVTSVGSVELAAGDLAPETAYQAKVVASYAFDGTAYSAETAWTDFTTTAIPPEFAAFAADGSAGDAISVSGAMVTPGEVVIQVSTTEDFASVYDSFAAGLIDAEGAFAHVFHSDDTAAPNYIAPGETYYVRAVATKGDARATSGVLAIATPAGSTAVVTVKTHEGTAVSLTGTLDPKGAGTTEVHVLWCDDGESYDRDVVVATIGPNDPAGWTWNTTLESVETLFSYKIYTKNACATANWQSDPVAGPDTELPVDTSSVFKWVADENGDWSGNWTDRKHWKPYKDDGVTPYQGYHADYPDQDTANLKRIDFGNLEGANAVITLPATTVRWGTVTTFPGANNASITFRGTPGQTTIVRDNSTAEFTFNNTDSSLVFDGLSIGFSANVNVYGAGSALVVQNHAYFKTSGKIRLGSESPYGSSYDRNIVLVVDDATVDLSGGDRNRSIWASVKLPVGQDKPATLIVRGKNPKLLLSCFADLGGDGKVVFNIPNGGYKETPIVFQSTNSEAQRLPYRQESAGQVKAVRFMVDRDSEAIARASARMRTYELVDWSKGIDPKYALLDGDGEEMRVMRTRKYRFRYDDPESPTKISVDIRGPGGLVITVCGTTPVAPGPQQGGETEDPAGPGPTGPEVTEPEVTGDGSVSIAWSDGAASARVPTCVLLATTDDATASAWQSRLNALGVTTARITGDFSAANAAACGQRAVRLARSQASAKGLENFGVMADTSGSRLALTLATSSTTPAYEAKDATDGLACNLDFACVDSPDDFVQGASANVTLVSGDQEEPDAALDASFAFDAQTCPIWVAHGSASGAGYWTANLIYRKMKIFLGKPSELHLYGAQETGARVDRAAEFMKQIGMLGEKGKAVSLESVYADDDDRGSYEKEFLWPENQIPGPDGTTFESTAADNVPYIEWHLPKVKTTDSVLIVYSGGSYTASQPDGKEVAPARRRLNELGMPVVTLHYRATGHNDDGHRRAWQDVQRAIRLVRSKAAAKGLDPNQIGIMGSSAGGHMTLAVATSSETSFYTAVDSVDALSAKPQFAVAVYPAYLITGACNTTRIAPITTDLKFDASTPPILFLHGDADTWPSMGSVKTWEKLRRTGVGAGSELHIFAQNGHTFMSSVYPGTGAYNYVDRVWDFIAAHGFAE